MPRMLVIEAYASNQRQIAEGRCNNLASPKGVFFCDDIDRISVGLSNPPLIRPLPNDTDFWCVFGIINLPG
jgi:hypothetical protein